MQKSKSAFYSILLKTTLNLILFNLILLSQVFSQENVAKAITPFTGLDYVRIVTDADFKSESKNTFKVFIKSIADGKVLWQGPVKSTSAVNEGGKKIAFLISGLKPILWTPNQPYLYQITLEQYHGKKIVSQLTERAGFRSFERKGENLYLNGKPIFLRGIAINPPERGIPTELEYSRNFAIDYVKFMKSINVNIIRIPDAEEWYDVCDELGMMVFGGNYGGKVAGGEKVKKQEAIGDETDGGFPSDYDRGVSWYENEKLGAIAHHPSLMVYAMTNETPFRGSRALLWEKFLDYAFHKLKAWDETRVYIANAGYGYGKTGDICDLHRYWGWYYSSPYTFLNIRDNANIIPFPKSGQPITFTECVGNYTGPDGRYNQTPGHKNPSSQLTWTGHERQDLQSQLADKHQSFTFRQATETFRQLRDKNHALSGVFPFTILFYNWDTIEKFADMNPKPVTAQVKVSYQPVLLSWECWTSKLYAGSTFSPVAHIINDDNDFKDLKNVKLVYQIYDKARTAVVKDSISFSDIPYYGTSKKAVNIKLPEHIVSGDYTLNGEVYANGKKVSQNFFKLFIADDGFKGQLANTSSKITLYDTKGDTKKSFKKLNIPFQEFTGSKDLSNGTILVIGENSADEKLASTASSIKDFMKKGGRVLALRQDSSSRVYLNKLLDFKLTNNTVDIDNGVYPVSTTAARNGFNINPERKDHPVFSGISRDNLIVWSDYTNWSEEKTGMPAIYPVTDAFKLEDADGMSSTAILADLNYGLQSIALAEQFMGSGSILICGFDISNRTGLDPVADKLLINMLNYSASNEGHQLQQLVTNPIIWGDYTSEKGLIIDSYNGFIANGTPRLTDAFLAEGIKVTKEGYQLAGGHPSRFNTRPGLQYVVNGRRPWGPYDPSYGRSPTFSKSSKSGTAQFWCRIPKGKNNMNSVVWNPSAEALTVKIKVNDLKETNAVVQAGEYKSIDSDVDDENVKVVYQGDRRLVMMETSFNKK
nr:glycoside hydrolase family 2 TIM barrel-domain containing protein [uncultured Pedobacter sp.]